MTKTKMELLNKSTNELKYMLAKLNIPISKHFRKKEYYIDKYLEIINSDSKSLSFIMSDNK